MTGEDVRQVFETILPQEAIARFCRACGAILRSYLESEPSSHTLKSQAEVKADRTGQTHAWPINLSTPATVTASRHLSKIFVTLGRFGPSNRPRTTGLMSCMAARSTTFGDGTGPGLNWARDMPDKMCRLCQYNTRPHTRRQRIRVRRSGCTRGELMPHVRIGLMDETPRLERRNPCRRPIMSTSSSAI